MFQMFRRESEVIIVPKIKHGDQTVYTRTPDSLIWNTARTPATKVRIPAITVMAYDQLRSR